MSRSPLTWAAGVAFLLSASAGRPRAIGPVRADRRGAVRAQHRPREHGRARHRTRGRARATRTRIYVATAGGGVWKTTDGGTTLKPVFDDQPTQCIGAVDRVSGEAGGGVRRHRRGQPAELGVVGQRRVQVRRRRQDLDRVRAEGHAPHRPHRGSPDEPGHRLRRGARSLLGAEPGARAVQDDRRRQDVGEEQVHRREHRVRGRADGPGGPGHAVRCRVGRSPRRLSPAAARARSTARAAGCSRRPTPARRGRR